MTDWIGRTLSKVEVQKLVGRGGMAEVYLGRHTTLNRPVAVKVLQAHLSEDENLLGRFKTEAQAVAAMRHPNIVQVFDFDILDDQPYMVMELLEGPSLKEYMSILRHSGGALPPKTIARLIASLAAALDYAHARGIVHRDIKPANIMLRREAGQVDPTAPLPRDVEPVLTDFGVARIANTAAQTASGAIIGTPAYMSPEQVQSHAVDSRSDIYSLGIVLYELLTGRLPFDADTQASILLKQISEPPPPLPEDYAALQPVIDRALAKEPTHRFQKASDLAAVLSASLGIASSRGDTEPHLSIETIPAGAHLASTASTPVTPTSGGAATTFQPSAGLNPLWVVAGIGGLALVVGMVALGITLGGGRGEGGQVLPPPATAATVEAGGQPTGEATAAQPPPTQGVAAAPVGEAVFRNDTLSVTLSGLQPPPDGSAYEAWLTEPDASPLSLGTVQLSQGEATLQFTDPDGSVLLGKYSGFAISVEPTPDPDPAMSDSIAYTAQVAPEVVQRIRLLLDVSGSTDLKTALLNGMNAQAEHYNSHLGFAIDGINKDDLAGAKRHAEHVINITVGREGPEYADWDGSGRIENPGDDVGLRPYLQILKDMAAGAANVPDAPAGAQETANTITASADTLLQTINEAVRLCEQVSTADTVDVLKGLVVRLDGVRVQTAFVTLTQQAQALDLVIAVAVTPAAP